MGCCASHDAQDQQVSKAIAQDREIDLGIIKLLLLGSGGSGKSTLFKQLQYIHGGGFEPRQRRMFQSQIHEQLIEAMKLMIEKCEEYWEDDAEANARYMLYNYEVYERDDIELSEQELRVQTVVEQVLAIRNNQKMTQEIIDGLRFLWNHQCIQLMYEQRNAICVPESTAFFMNDLERITNETYMPTDTDLLLVRYRTTGMQEKEFEIGSRPFLICDVGGQRNERRKWMHFFDNVTSVIFVVALSCYDELTYESATNAMVESLDVFSEHMNSSWFGEMDFILFLNKSDLYLDKIKTVPLTVAPCFKSYSGPKCNADEGLIYIKQVFINHNKNPDRSFFQHVTCATDRDQIKKVFNDVQTMIINWALTKAGLA